MSGKRVSENGKNVSEDSMSTIALERAVRWHDELMDAEFKGRKDKESATRFRLSKKIGVPESYLFRLAHKRREMRDVAGEVYRRLEEAHKTYVGLCERNEQAADAMRAERLALKAKRHATDHEPASAGVGASAPRHGTTKEAMR
jgi:hypothetical protein